MKKNQTPKYIVVIDYESSYDPRVPMFTYHAAGNDPFDAMQIGQKCIDAAEFPTYCAILYERTGDALKDAVAYRSKMRWDYTLAKHGGKFRGWNPIICEKTDLKLNYKQCAADAGELSGYAEFSSERLDR